MLKKVERGTEGIKFDSDKLRLDLIPPEVEEQLALVLGYGAEKYGDRNWERGLKWSRVYSAAQRHLLSFWKGEDRDEESEFSHLSHALCCIAFLVAYEQRKMKEWDDRPKIL